MDPYSNSKSYSVLTVVSSKGREEENNWAPAPRLRVLMLPPPPPPPSDSSFTYTIVVLGLILQFTMHILDVVGENAVIP